MADRPIFPGTVKTAGLDIENGDGTTPQDLITAGSKGSRVTHISAVSDDGSDSNLQLFYHDGTTAFLLGTIKVTTLSGTDGTAASVSLLNATALPFLNADLSLYIEAGKKLQVGPLVAVTAAKKVTLVCQYGDY